MARIGFGMTLPRNQQRAIALTNIHAIRAVILANEFFEPHEESLEGKFIKEMLAGNRPPKGVSTHPNEAWQHGKPYPAKNKPNLPILPKARLPLLSPSILFPRAAGAMIRAVDSAPACLNT